MSDIPDSLRRVHANPAFWARVRRGKNQIMNGESVTVTSLDELSHLIAKRREEFDGNDDIRL